MLGPRPLPIEQLAQTADDPLDGAGLGMLGRKVPGPRESMPLPEGLSEHQIAAEGIENVLPRSHRLGVAQD